MTRGSQGVHRYHFDPHYWRQPLGIQIHLEQRNCMKVKNTRGGLKKNQEITASLNHKGPFINFSKTSYTDPWDYLRINKIKKNLSCSDTLKCKIYIRQSYAIIWKLFHTGLHRLDLTSKTHLDFIIAFHQTCGQSCTNLRLTILAEKYTSARLC